MRECVSDPLWSDRALPTGLLPSPSFPLRIESPTEGGKLVDPTRGSAQVSAGRNRWNGGRHRIEAWNVGSERRVKPTVVVCAWRRTEVI